MLVKPIKYSFYKRFTKVINLDVLVLSNVGVTLSLYLNLIKVNVYYFLKQITTFRN